MEILKYDKDQLKFTIRTHDASIQISSTDDVTNTINKSVEKFGKSFDKM